MSVPMLKHPAIVVTVLAVSIMLIWGFWPQAVSVEVVLAERAPLTVSIEAEGRTRVIDRYQVSAPVDGVACRVGLKVGDEVKKGQYLLGISPLRSQVLDLRTRAQAKATVAGAKSALSSAKEQALVAEAEQTLMQRELTRIEPLLKKGLVSKDAYDRAESKATSAEATKRSADFKVEVAQYELEAARMMLDYSSESDSSESVSVNSPISGRILKISHECEGPVRTGDPLLEVGDPSALEVEVDVLSADAVKIKRGMKVVFERWGGEQVLQGRVRVVEPVGFTKTSALGVDEQRVLVISDFTSPEALWQRLGDGYRVEAKFILSHDENVLQVPSTSLFRHQEGWALFVVDGSNAYLKIVEVGRRDGLMAEITSGLTAGDRIINHPGDAVVDGIKIFEH